MYYIKVSNRENCILETREVKDYDNDSIKAIFNEYQKPASIHVDIETEMGRPVADYHWDDFKK